VGRVSPLAAPTKGYVFLGLAADGRRLAAVTTDIHEMPLWILDPSRGTLARLPGEGEAGWPRWTPDSQRIAFSRLVDGVR
jgi:Tol biopolymer transport system component